jgi:3-dehydroquinate dehydratase II
MKRKNKNKVLVIHGPNLHLLGKREPDIYGNCTLSTINTELRKKAKTYKITIEIIQSNSEGKLVEKITEGNYDFLIINPAAYTHTSVAIRDALLAVEKPAIEVHLSNVHKREDFRKHSLISDVVIGTISGLNELSYYLALEASCTYLKTCSKKS